MFKKLFKRNKSVSMTEEECCERISSLTDEALLGVLNNVLSMYEGASENSNEDDSNRNFYRQMANNCAQMRKAF